MNTKNFMLCESITEQEALNLNADFKANIKYDGERIQAIKVFDVCFLINRNGKIVNTNFFEVYNALKCLDFDFILDGEIVVFDNALKSDFSKLQSRALTQNAEKKMFNEQDKQATYVIFDILRLNNINLTNKPLKERLLFLDDFFKKIIDYRLIGDTLIPKQYFNTPPILQKCEYGEIKEILEKAKENKEEGIIIKNLNSVYQNKRSQEWLKLKFFKKATLTLTKYTINNAGCRCEDNLNNAVQVAGYQSLEVMNKINSIGSCEVIIQYLEKTKNERYRFISFKGIKNNFELTEKNISQQAGLKKNE